MITQSHEDPPETVILAGPANSAVRAWPTRHRGLYVIEHSQPCEHGPYAVYATGGGPLGGLVLPGCFAVKVCASAYADDVAAGQTPTPELAARYGGVHHTFALQEAAA